MNSEEKLGIVICGGGNGSHASVAHIGSTNKYRVNVYTRKPQEWSNQIVAYTNKSSWSHKGNLVGNIETISNNPQDFKDPKIWIIGGPAHVHHQILQKIAPYVTENSFVGTMFGQGGFDWMSRDVFGERLEKENITAFGLFSIPYICKIEQYGKSVNIIGPKTKLLCAMSNQNRQKELLLHLETMYDIPSFALPNFLSLTLVPGNQIIHPPRVYSLFKDWDGKAPSKEVPFFYETFDQFSADMLQHLSDEIQEIKKQILQRYPTLDLSIVEPIKERVITSYGQQISDTSTLKTVIMQFYIVVKTFETNQAYKHVRVPMKPVEGGFVLNTDARIFWEDIPYGLVILKDLAQMLDVNTPAVDKMIEWHQQFMGKEFIKNGKLNTSILSETGAPSKYGMDNIEKVIGQQGFQNAKL